MWGIDFNRDIPPKKFALEMFHKFVDGKDRNSLFRYGEKYGWVAINEEDYNRRLYIYKKFWRDIGKGNFIILIHRAFPRIKLLPGIIDVLSFNSELKEKLLQTVDKINFKYRLFFKNVEKDYKQMVLFEEKRIVSNILKVHKTFDLNKMNLEFKQDLKKDLEVVKKFAEEHYLKRLEKHFTPKNFIFAVKNALKNIGPPKVTVERAFKGSLSFGPKRMLESSKTVIQIEPTRFMNFWYPKVAADIIKEIVVKLR